MGAAAKEERGAGPEPRAAGGEAIVAVASAPGASERAVLRLSGAGVWGLGASVFRPFPERPGRVVSGSLELPGWPPAPAWALAFRGPRSYTGEDAVELWLPGAPPLLRRTLLELQARGARLADRGEFTRRAFLNDRLDLTQVEAVLALSTSEDERAARAAQRALAGGLRARVDALQDELLRLRAHIEAAIDYSEEELELLAPERLARALLELAARVRALAGGEGGRALTASVPRVVLRGPANAGKSSLFNALLARDAALVSPEAGTTRDALAAEWRLPSGRAVLLLDTAGDKVPASATEARALSGAAEAASAADLVVYLRSVDAPAPGAPPAGALPVWSKRDLGPAPGPGLAVSARSGEGLRALAAAVDARLGEAAAACGLWGSARQEAALGAADAALRRAAEVL
ncbi:MAG: tRNA uridine-5-carboxymethylaminomethyl(34) synthesis GTPase MnmE, partial [Planctomycetota bacterium]